MATLPGVKPLLEPYKVPYHRSHPFKTAQPFNTAVDYTFEEATEMVKAVYPGKTVVFVKDFPCVIPGKFETFLDDSFTHSFLICNPKRVIMSYYKLMKKGSFTMDKFKEACTRGDIGDILG